MTFKSRTLIAIFLSITSVSAFAFPFQVTNSPNLNLDQPSCVIACYSHTQQDSIYDVAIWGANKPHSIYVHGFTRVNGHYHGRVCQPMGYEYQDISAMQEYKDLCNQTVLSCEKHQDCWAGGDTGGYVFGE